MLLNYFQTLSDNKMVQKILQISLEPFFLKQNDLKKSIKENETKIVHIRDWISSIVENEEEWKTPRVLTLDALNNAADKYFQKKNNKLKTIELDKTHEKLIVNLGDYYVVQMLTPQALDNESKIMQHCIGHGTYDKNLNKEEFKYLSLRDKYNKAHITLEMFQNCVLQLQGKQNNVPDFKYLNILIPWLFKNKYHTYLDRYNLIYNKIDSKIYSIFDLPNNCETDNNIDLSYQNIEHLPKNFKINGNICLKGCKDFKKIQQNTIINGDLILENCINLEYLPEDLIVTGNLNLKNTQIKIMPNIKIGKNLYMNYSKIEKLPDDFIINGDLDLKHCKNIKILPKNLTIYNNIDLQYSEIEKISDNLKVYGHTCLCNTKIKEIPEKIFLNKNIGLYGTKIEKIPDDFIVNGDIDLSFNKNIFKLPKNLTVKGDLYLNDCNNLQELPNNLIIHGSLNLTRTNIKELPKDIKIGKNLKLSYSTIEKLPDNLTINGYLNLGVCHNIKSLPNKLNIGTDLTLRYTEIETLPDNIKINNNLYLTESKITKLPTKLKCNIIYIEEKQINLIKKSMNFKKIFIDYKNEFSKDDFFKNKKEKCKCIKQ